jgi:hypothetical protein
MVFELLGPNLEDLLQHSLQTSYRHFDLVDMVPHRGNHPRSVQSGESEELCTESSIPNLLVNLIFQRSGPVRAKPNRPRHPLYQCRRRMTDSAGSPASR